MKGSTFWVCFVCKNAIIRTNLQRPEKKRTTERAGWHAENVPVERACSRKPEGAVYSKHASVIVDVLREQARSYSGVGITL